MDIILSCYCRYKCNINITELITLEEVMEEYNLGPNGGLLFCMEFLLKNIQWLFDRLHEFPCIRIVLGLKSSQLCDFRFCWSSGAIYFKQQRQYTHQSAGKSRISCIVIHFTVISIAGGGKPRRFLLLLQTRGVHFCQSNVTYLDGLLFFKAFSP